MVRKCVVASQGQLYKIKQKVNMFILKIFKFVLKTVKKGQPLHNIGLNRIIFLVMGKQIFINVFITIATFLISVKSSCSLPCKSGDRPVLTETKGLPV